jgi:hypothetical protein
MPTKRKKTVKRRKMRGGRLKENDRNAMKENDRNRFKENNLAPAYIDNQRAILNTIKHNPVIPLAVPNYPSTGSVPLFDRIRGFLKKGKYISKTARSLGAHGIADFAEQYGYGKRRKKRKTKKTTKRKTRRKTTK